LGKDEAQTFSSFLCPSHPLSLALCAFLVAAILGVWNSGGLFAIFYMCYSFSYLSGRKTGVPARKWILAEGFFGAKLDIQPEPQIVVSNFIPLHPAVGSIGMLSFPHCLFLFLLVRVLQVNGVTEL